MTLDCFPAIWVADFQFSREPGERPVPLQFQAKELKTGRQLCLSGSQLNNPPFSTGSDAFFAFFNAPAQLGCYLALNWPTPDNILDLLAETRCLTSGLSPPRDLALKDALGWFKKSGEGLEGLEQLLAEVMKKTQLDHALFRGRYTAAVAQMETIGIPIDMDLFLPLKESWG